MTSTGMSTGLSIVIPALNEAARLPATLAALSAPAGGGGEAPEILVSDGGSRDATAELAQGAGAQVVTGAQGRGTQLAAGAAAAQGDWLLFLHADTRLASGWRAAAAAFMADPANRQRAGYGRFRLDDPHPRARRLEKRVAWRWPALRSALWRPGAADRPRFLPGARRLPAAAAIRGCRPGPAHRPDAARGARYRRGDRGGTVFAGRLPPPLGAQSRPAFALSHGRTAGLAGAAVLTCRPVRRAAARSRSYS